jgi:hypothetical protein
MKRAKSVIDDLYFHDGRVGRIYYDASANQLLLEIQLPEEIQDLNKDYGNSFEGVLTFYGVEENSIISNHDYNQINHPFWGTEILAVKYSQGESTNNLDRIELDLHIDKQNPLNFTYLNIKFLSTEYNWFPYENQTSA